MTVNEFAAFADVLSQLGAGAQTVFLCWLLARLLKVIIIAATVVYTIVLVIRAVVGESGNAYIVAHVGQALGVKETFYETPDGKYRAAVKLAADALVEERRREEA